MRRRSRRQGKRPRSRIANRSKEEKDHVVLGHGEFHEKLKPFWSHMDGSRIEMKTKAEASEELDWHRENNPDFDVRVFRLEPVAFSHDS
jgi:hypothetical protein